MFCLDGVDMIRQVLIVFAIITGIILFGPFIFNTTIYVISVVFIGSAVIANSKLAIYVEIFAIAAMAPVVVPTLFYFAREIIDIYIDSKSTAYHNSLTPLEAEQKIRDVLVRVQGADHQSVRMANARIDTLKNAGVRKSKMKIKSERKAMIRNATDKARR